MNSRHPKISIVIPTRNRAEYLEEAIASCLRSDDDNLEVIVSDNNSVDHTREVAERFNDPRLKYYHTGENLSMRANFEFALERTTGDYITFIGDDDGFSRNGLHTLRLALEAIKPDILNWRHINYSWPGTFAGGEHGSAKIRSRYFFAPFKSHNSRRILDDFCAARKTRYKAGGNIYHGCVSRAVIETIRYKTGTYFLGQSPDVYACLANLTASKKVHRLGHRITIGGTSAKSNGESFFGKGTKTDLQRHIAQDFSSLGAQDVVESETDPRLRTAIVPTYALLVRVNELLMENRLTIHHEKWRARIVKDVLALPLHDRMSGLAALDAFFAKQDPHYRPASPSFAQMADALNAEPHQPAIRPTPPRLKDVPPAATQSLLALADWLDALMPRPSIPYSFWNPHAYLYWAGNVLRFRLKKKRLPASR